jgi:hypothetical protein
MKQDTKARAYCFRRWECLQWNIKDVERLHRRLLTYQANTRMAILEFLGKLVVSQ